MKSMDWQTGAVTGGCVCLGIVLGILIGGALAPPVTTEPWLKSYAGLIGAILGLGGAAVGLLVTTRNVLRQMRINLMSREEERMETQLRGLQEAQALLSHFELDTRYRVPGDAGRAIIAELNARDMKGDAAIDAHLAEALPDVDIETRRQLSARLKGLRHIAVALVDAQTRYDETLKPFEEYQPAKEMLEGIRGRFEYTLQVISEFREVLEDRTRRYTTQLPKFRREIERYFAD